MLFFMYLLNACVFNIYEKAIPLFKPSFQSNTHNLMNRLETVVFRKHMLPYVT